MKNAKPLVFIFLFLLIFRYGNAQQSEIDSLKRVVFSQADDTAKVRSLNHLCHVMASSNDFSGIKFAEEAKNLSEKLNYKPGLAMSYRSIGWINYYQSNYEEAMKNYFEAEKLDEESGNKTEQATDLLGIGNIYSAMSNNSQALNSFLKAEEIIRSLPDKHKLGNVYYNISSIYLAQNNYDKAMDYAVKAKQEAENSNDKIAEAVDYNNIGTIFQYQFQNDDAMKSFNAALAIYDTIGDKEGITQEESAIANVYRRQGNISESIKWNEKALIAATEIQNTTALRDIYQGLADDYRETGKYQEALNYYMRYSTLNDSILYQDNTAKISQMEMKYENEKKEMEIKRMQDEQDKLIHTVSGRSSTFALIGVAVLILLAFLIYIIISAQKISNLKATIENERAMNFNKFQKPGNSGNFRY